MLINPAMEIFPAVDSNLSLTISVRKNSLVSVASLLCSWWISSHFGASISHPLHIETCSGLVRKTRLSEDERKEANNEESGAKQF